MRHIDGTTLARWCASPESYETLALTESADGTWQAGACTLLAKALKTLAPAGKLVGVVWGGAVQHVGLLLGDTIYDANGAHDPIRWVSAWLDYEGLTWRGQKEKVGRVTITSRHALPGPASTKDVRLVAAALRDARLEVVVARENPERAEWEAVEQFFARNPGVKLDFHTKGPDAIEIEMFSVPRGQRRKGEGTRLFQEFEAALPKHIKRIDLYAADTGSGPSHGFWEKMGFDYKYNDPEDENHPKWHELKNWMVKIVAPAEHACDAGLVELGGGWVEVADCGDAGPRNNPEKPLTQKERADLRKANMFWQDVEIESGPAALPEELRDAPWPVGPDDVPLARAVLRFFYANARGDF